jgi:ubiquinone/menaquinone biosynthesis C-methylase UbiE
MRLFRRKPKATPAPNPSSRGAKGYAAAPTDLTLEQRARLSGDPFTISPYFDSAENDIQWEWDELLLPFLSAYPIDYSSVVDFAAGHGRNTAYLLPLSQHITIVDINQSNIDYCRTRFGMKPHLTYLTNDGVSLRGIGDNTVSFLYSFDSMVHFEPEVIEAYTHEFLRVLQPGGMGFCHHSNYSENPGRDFKENPHWRNNMSAERFAALCRAAGLEMVEQRVIDWVGTPALDCLSLFRKPAE